MNLDKIAAQLRLKTPFEAVDLGFLLAQRFAQPLWTAWLTILGPLFFLILTVAYFTNSFWIPLMILWWLKPVYARIPVIVLSRAFFGSTPTQAQTLHAFPKAARKASTIWQITIARLSPFRGFFMYINDLEGGTSTQRRQRAQVLRNHNLDMAVYALFFIAMTCEWVLFVACIMFFELVQPPSMDFNLFDNITALIDGESTQPLFNTFLLASYALAVSLVEPIFAAGNFGLYISRRVELEGWDIEIAFRKLASRIHSKNQGNIPTNTALILIASALSALFLLAPTSAVAQDFIEPTEEICKTSDIVQTTPADPQIQSRIKEILTAPEFGQPEIQKSWKLRDQYKPKPKASKQNIPLIPFGQIFSAIAWALAIVLVILLIVFLVRRISIPSRSKKGISDDWQQRFETNASTPKIASDLPEDIIAHARAAHAKGDQTRALTLLYAGMLRALQRDLNIELAPGLTAYETTRHVRKNNGPHDIVAEIANAWTARVFAHKTLDDLAFETILQRWQATFSNHPSNPQGTP